MAAWLTLAALLAVQDGGLPLRVEPTDLLRGPREDPRAVLSFAIEEAHLETFHEAHPETLLGGLRVRVLDAAGGLLHELPPGSAVGRRLLLAVPLPAEGSEGKVTVELLDGADIVRTEVTYPPPDTGWTLHFVAAFHDDQGSWQGGHPARAPLEQHLELAERDGDYRVVLHELPGLRPWLEAVPGALSRLRAALGHGRAGLVGGTYGELPSSLVGAEAAVRNAAYGQRFQRDVLGGSGAVFWQLDVFGHDPSFPALMADSGHLAGVIARGPFQPWGLPVEALNFPSEFQWTAPDGRSVLTHALTTDFSADAQHLVAEAPQDPLRRELLVADAFAELKRLALTRHVLLPLQAGASGPLEGLGPFVREWNATYLSPRAVVDTPDDFFDAVAAEVRSRELVVPVITRDMNPVATGAQVAYADLALANRAVESTLREAEIFATAAALLGAPFPSSAIDRAWRQLLFAAHHVGSPSDETYIDLLACYRGALELARGVRQLAITYLSHHVDTRAIGEGVVVWNSLAAPRDGTIERRGSSGDTVTQLVQGVPAVGYRVVEPQRLERADPSLPEGVLENEHLRLVVDPEQGGALVSLVDKHTGRELLSGPAAVLELLSETPVLPGREEGPWHLRPTGAPQPDTGFPAHLLPRDPRHPQRLVLEGVGPAFRKRHVVELVPGERRVDFETTILDWRGSDELLRVTFPIDLRGARPVHQTAAAVIARPFARDVDSATDPATLDQTCWQWAGLGATAVLEVREEPLGVVTDGTGRLLARRALGVAEIVLGDGAPPERQREANDLARALVRCGVTSTITVEGRRRYGDLALDSSAPDVRILLGSPEEHALLAATLGEHRLQHVPSCAWIEPEHDLPVLVVPAGDGTLSQVLDELDASQRVVVTSFRSILQPRPDAPERGVALLNAGSASVHVTDGVLALNLLRSCTSWPAGPLPGSAARRLPDGAPFGTMHGSHTFRYSLLPHEGDWRAADLNTHADRVNHPLIARPEPAHDGLLPPAASFLEIDVPGVSLLALKPAGFPEAGWASARSGPPDRIVARLWNGTGRPVEAGLRLAVPVGTAWLANLLEQRVAPLEIRAGRVAVPLAAHAVETVLLEVQPAPPDLAAPSLDPTAGSISPAAWWLEHRGEDIARAGVVSIVPASREVVLEHQTESVPIHVANHHADQSASVSLAALGSPELLLALDPPTLVLLPGEERELLLTLAPSEHAPTGRSLVELLADVVLEPQGTGERLPGGDDAGELLGGASRHKVRANLWVRPFRAAGPRRAITIENAARLVPAGSQLAATLHNHTSGPIRGVATWIGPVALWPHVADWRREVLVPAGGSLDVVAPLGPADDTWALLEFAYGGELVRGETLAITGRPDRRLISFGVDRVRLGAGGEGMVSVSVRSLQGLARSSSVLVHGPEGMVVAERERRFSREPDGSLLLEVDFALDGTLAPPRGELLAEEGRGVPPTTARVDYLLAPQQLALPDLAEVRVDGNLGEWHEAEFTRISDERGAVEAAVRYGPDGLALAFSVADERFSQPHVGAALWEGDSIQFAFTPRPNESLGYGASDLELGAALTGRGPVVWCWYGGGGRAGPVEGAEISVRREERRTLYELRLPREALPGLSLEPGSVLGFSYIANDDDGQGYEGATQWTDGMVDGKDSSRFGELVLAPG